jgi:hypothetical protein
MKRKYSKPKLEKREVLSSVTSVIIVSVDVNGGGIDE